MAWTKVGQSTFTVASGAGTENKTLPGSPAQNDIVLVLLANDTGTIGITSGQGYDIIAADDGSNSPSHQIGGKRMGATPDTVVTINQGSASITAGLIQIWRGADTATYQDMAAVKASGAVNGAPDPPSATTVTNGALFIACGLLDDDDVASSVTAPSGYTNLLAGDTGQASVTVGSTVMIASKEIPTAGAENPAAFGGGLSDLWRAYSFALRPAAAAAAAKHLMLLGVGT